MQIDYNNDNNGLLNGDTGGLVFGHNSSGEGIASNRLNGSHGPKFGLNFITEAEIRMAIDLAGKVGIGTETPQEKLHVDGGKIKLDGTGSTYLSVYEKGSGGESRFWTHTNGEVYIQNSNGINFGGINDSSRFMSILSNGNIGIGTKAPQSKLAVNGKITAKEVEVTSSGWADFVFNDDYKLKSLLALETYIKTHKHLPEIPSEETIIKEGLKLGDMLKLQMQKIEELTLYIIEQEKRIQAIEKENALFRGTSNEKH